MDYETEAHLDAIFGVGKRPLCIARSEPCPGEVRDGCQCPIVKTSKGASSEKRVKQKGPTYDAVAASYAERGITHRSFPSLSRVFKYMVITEKIDGSNAAIGITEDGEVYAQSRTKLIMPGPSDLAGFAEFVAENAEKLHDGLGPGLHFGEWWGQKIQRTYGLTERRFSLFNTGRWDSEFNQREDYILPLPTNCLQCPILHVVPVLVRWTFDTVVIKKTLADLMVHGSYAAPGFQGDPEGIVVYHAASGTSFKYTEDDRPKGAR